MDLNCDLGEGEPLEQTAELMRWIGSANVACGGHAGSLRSMERCVRLAKEFGVKLGAHPGLPGAFGRGAVDLSLPDFELLLVQQVGTLKTVADAAGVSLHHVKLHGALYFWAELPERAECLVRTLQHYFEGLKVYALAGGCVLRTARAHGLEAAGEAFADRAYRADGTLVPRAEAGSVIHSGEAVLARLQRLISHEEIEAIDGAILKISADTICVHGDTPGAGDLVKDAAKLLDALAK